MTNQHDDVLDISSMIDADMPADASKSEAPRVSSSPAPRAPREATTEQAGGHEEAFLEDRLKEDLKLSYNATGVLDVTVGGYGFLRQDYAINPQKDIYVSTSQIRRFWLRR